MKERLSGWFWPMLAINAHIEIVLWWVTSGLTPLGHSSIPKEGKNSLSCWKTSELTPKPTLGQTCALSSIEPSHPVSRRDPGARFPCVHPMMGLPLPTALSLFLPLGLIQIQSHSSTQWTHAICQELSTCLTWIKTKTVQETQWPLTEVAPSILVKVTSFIHSLHK